MHSYKIKSERELQGIVPELIKDFDGRKVILFYGEMGVGKTTLIKLLCGSLGVEETTSSPTFSIVNEYLSVTNESIFHFDFFRIKKETEVFDLGYEDYFYSGDYCFIEWPEKIPNLLPDNAVEINILQDEDKNRLISIVK